MSTDDFAERIRRIRHQIQVRAANVHSGGTPVDPIISDILSLIENHAHPVRVEYRSDEGWSEANVNDYTNRTEEPS